MQSSSRMLLVVAALVCAAVVCTSPAAGHHSFAAVFDMGIDTEIEGRITKIDWANPHIKIYVADRDEQVWEVEAGPVNLLERMEIDRRLFKVGETIRARGNPGRRNPRALWVSNILLPDRTEVLAGTDTRPYLPWGALKTVGGGFEDPVPALSGPARSLCSSTPGRRGSRDFQGPAARPARAPPLPFGADDEPA